MGFYNDLWGAWRGLADAFAPKPIFKTDQIPDLSGQIMLVTGACRWSLPRVERSIKLCVGANTGIGKETVKVCTNSLHAAAVPHLTVSFGMEGAASA